MTTASVLKRLGKAARSFADRYDISAVKIQFLLVGVGVILLAASTTLSILKVRSGYESAVAEYKSTLWYATQIEFEFSRFLNALDLMGTGENRLGATDVLPRFQVLQRRLPALVRGIQSNTPGGPGRLGDDINRLTRILENIEAPLRSLKPGDIRTYLQIRSEVESGLAPLRTMIVETEARGEGEFESRQSRIAPFFSDMLIYAVGTFVGGIVLILILIRQIKHTHRAMAKVEQAQREMAAAKEEAEEANRAKSHFLAVMSHEIRTPMNGVLGMASLLAESKLADQQREYLDTIRGSGEALLTILNDILDFSKLEVGRVELEQARFDPADIVEDAASLFATAAHEKGIEVAVELDPTLPIAISSDPGRLRQILLNLVGNAVKFTEVGGVILSASVERGAGKSPVIRFEIADSGIGVPPDRRQMLFQEFRQADPSVSRRFGGTGLGLAICKRLVGLLGGEIGQRANSENNGNGSVFHFTIPVGADVEWARSVSAPAAAAGDLAGRHAIVVCDNPILCRDVFNHLAPYGITVAEERDPLDVLDRIEAGGSPKVDLLLIDARIPGFQPDAYAERLKQKGQPLVPVVLVLPTAGAMAGSIEDQNVFAATIRKPLRRREVRQVLRHVLLGEDSGEMPLEAVAAPTAMAPAGRYRLLLAEDGRVNQIVATAMLERAGYAVDVVGDGISALHALEARPYDLVLMDIHMPEADGFQATAAIRALGNENANVSIIAMTANALADNRDACLAAGMDGFLTKPINREEMLRTIAEKLSAADRTGSETTTGETRLSSRGTSSNSAPDSSPDSSEELSRELSALGADDQSDGPPIIDGDVFAQFGRDVGGDYLSILLDEFITEVHDNIARARENATVTNHNEAGRLVHSLKSSAGTIGAVRLEACAEIVERACFEGRLEGLDEEFSRLETEARLAIERLPAYLKVAESEGERLSAAAPAVSETG